MAYVRVVMVAVLMIICVAVCCCVPSVHSMNVELFVMLSLVMSVNYSVSQCAYNYMRSKTDRKPV